MRRLNPWLVAAVAFVVLAAGAAVAAVTVRHRNAQQASSLASLRASGLPGNLPTNLANLMTLSPVGQRPVSAPGFTLTDQLGKTFSLSSFRGHPVVLNFMDPHCVTICPIIAQEFIDAEHRLARTTPGVVFLAINVNRHALSVATVDAFTKEHRLNTIKTWHFLTGTLASLERIWKAYGIDVATRIVHGQWTVVHTTVDYFIGPNGKERYVAAPTDEHHATPTHKAFLPATTYSAWGRGIAIVARDLAR